MPGSFPQIVQSRATDPGVVLVPRSALERLWVAVC